MEWFGTLSCYSRIRQREGLLCWWGRRGYDISPCSPENTNDLILGVIRHGANEETRPKAVNFFKQEWFFPWIWWPVWKLTFAVIKVWTWLFTRFSEQAIRRNMWWYNECVSSMTYQFQVLSRNPHSGWWSWLIRACAIPNCYGKYCVRNARN